MFSVDYTPKILHVAIRDLETRVIVDRDSKNGLIYMPDLVFSKMNTLAENHYHDFFQTEFSYTIVPLETEMGPGELVQRFREPYDAFFMTVIGGISAPFSVEPKKAQQLLRELRNNPQNYYNSSEKEYFTNPKPVLKLIKGKTKSPVKVKK